MNKDFEQFQKHFKYYQQKFGLTGYKIYFKHESLDGDFAQISVRQPNMNATVSLNNDLLDGDKPFKDIKLDAKHEAIHLLLHRFVCNGWSRFTQRAELEEAEEEVVRKLENLIE